jgi:pimeloyl-ACP methyl ester carboxylesterase
VSGGVTADGAVSGAHGGYLVAVGLGEVYELRGSGPPLLLIMAASGSSGVFEPSPDLRADDFTVVTCDRRGT